MPVTGEQRRPALLQMKLGALAKQHWASGGVAGSFPSGATLLDADAHTAWVLVEQPDYRVLGQALAWALRHGATELHLLLEADGETGGVVARRAAAFATPVRVWRVDGRDDRRDPAGALFPAPCAAARSGRLCRPAQGSRRRPGGRVGRVDRRGARPRGGAGGHRRRAGPAGGRRRPPRPGRPDGSCFPTGRWRSPSPRPSTRSGGCAPTGPSPTWPTPWPPNGGCDRSWWPTPTWSAPPTWPPPPRSCTGVICASPSPPRRPASTATIGRWWSCARPASTSTRCRRRPTPGSPTGGPGCRVVVAVPPGDDHPVTRALAADLRDPAEVVTVTADWRGLSTVA